MNKVKVFISQIMKDVPTDLIKDVRGKIEDGITELLESRGYEADIIDSYIDIIVPGGVDRSIYYLGESIKLLSSAHLVLIPKTPVDEYPGVKSESNIALNYDLPTFFYEFDKNNEIVFFNTRRNIWEDINNMNDKDYLRYYDVGENVLEFINLYPDLNNLLKNIPTITSYYFPDNENNLILEVVHDYGIDHPQLMCYFNIDSYDIQEDAMKLHDIDKEIMSFITKNIEDKFVTEFW